MTGVQTRTAEGRSQPAKCAGTELPGTTTASPPAKGASKYSNVPSPNHFMNSCSRDWKILNEVIIRVPQMSVSRCLQKKKKKPILELVRQVTDPLCLIQMWHWGNYARSN
ncbi:hypothetical protein CEXT_280471 [Caerostris extrusa]|uniref:Uncharacterized protein n=1 Tax=Caerostris extrusa TaxID=172846 RepID=A0AAV4NV29_CAEEX|nr:hypothetical protein CEXT_280471 [Caerostris extrusa]